MDGSFDVDEGDDVIFFGGVLVFNVADIVDAVDGDVVLDDMVDTKVVGIVDKSVWYIERKLLFTVNRKEGDVIVCHVTSFVACPDVSLKCSSVVVFINIIVLESNPV